jgi:diguanylate cyclase (GGDEF)-like protein/PAS domain S-box-containing protein
LNAVKEIGMDKGREIPIDSMIEAAPLAVFDLDPEGRVKSIWNRAAEETFGWQKEEVIGKRLPIVPEDKQEEFRNLRDRVLKGDSFSGVEVKRQRKDGSEIDVSISTAPIPDEDGQITGIMSYVEDITAKKNLKRSLKKSEEEFREIFDNANDAIYLHELTEEGMPGRFLKVNKVATEMLGYSKEEFLSMSPKEIDAGKEAEEVPEIMKELTSENQITFEMTHQAKDGTEVPVEISSRIIELRGEKLVLSVARDISERKETEKELQEVNERLERSKERYRKYFEESGDAIFILKMGGEEHGEILEANSTATEQTGYSINELVGMNLLDELTCGETRETNLQTVNEKLDRGETAHFTDRKVRKDGTKYWTEVVVTPIEHEGKQANLSINRDITERIRAQKALKEERERLKELHDAVDRFQACLTEEELFGTTLEVASKILGFEVAIIYAARDEKLVPVAANGIEVSRLPTYEKDEALAGKAYTKNETIRGDDVREMEEAKPENPELRAFMSVPIGDLAVLQAASKEVGAFTEVDVGLANIMAGHLNEEISRIRLEEELKHQAIRDPLTELYNRRYFNETLQKEIDQAERYDKPLAFLMMDVNRFKEINDRYSHQIGDQVLIEVAALLQENVRDADTVVRYGGDEFLVMLPETNGGASNTVNRLKDELNRWNEESDLLDFPLTLAMGASHWSPDQDRGVEQALKEADRKMYEEKET